MKPFRVFEMRYDGAPCESTLALSSLAPSLDAAYLAAYNAAYRPMREALECQPTDFYRDVSQLDARREDIYVWVEDGELLGGVAIYGHEIDDLFVAPAQQGRGLARALVTFAIARMQQAGVAPITLSVVDWNTRAHALYEKMGFVTTNTLHIGAAE